MHPTAEPPPLFCPRCRRDSGNDRKRSLCAHCGETLRPQGFCEVCERYWAMQVGAECPKHEIALVESAPEPLSPDVPPEGRTLVTVGVYDLAHEAHARRIRLEAEGVPTFLEGARMGSLGPYGLATGGVKLQVPLAYQDDARILLAQNWAPPRYPDDDLEDAWDDLEPDPRANHEGPADRIIWPLLAAMSLAALIAMAWAMRAG